MKLFQFLFFSSLASFFRSRRRSPDVLRFEASRPSPAAKEDTAAPRRSKSSASENKERFNLNTFYIFYNYYLYNYLYLYITSITITYIYISIL